MKKSLMIPSFSKKLSKYFDTVDKNKLISLNCRITFCTLLQRTSFVGAGFKPAPTDLIKHYPLSEIVCAFKTFASRYINELRKTQGISVWQRNYHEHIVRNENKLNRIREYIMNNPLRWQYDRENPDNINIGVGLKPTPTADDNQWDDFEEAIFGKK